MGAGAKTWAAQSRPPGSPTRSTRAKVRQTPEIFDVWASAVGFYEMILRLFGVRRMQLPQKKKTMPPADATCAGGAICRVHACGATGDILRRAPVLHRGHKDNGRYFCAPYHGHGTAHAPTMGSALGMPFGSQFSGRMWCCCLCQNITGTESVADDAPGADGLGPRRERRARPCRIWPPDGQSGPDAGECSPWGGEAAGAKKREKAIWRFLRQLC